METKVVAGEKADKLLRKGGCLALCFSQGFHKNMKWLVLTRFILGRKCPSLIPVFSEILYVSSRRTRWLDLVNSPDTHP